jgi:Fe2+ transport system protein FeoA
MSQDNQKWNLVFIGSENNAIVEEEIIDSSYISLASGNIGSRFVVAQIRCRDDLKQKLAGLGFMIGIDIEVISRTLSGSVVVQTHSIKNSIKIGLGALLAKNVFAIKG